MSAWTDHFPGLFRKRNLAEAATPSGDESEMASMTTTGGGLDNEPVVVWEAANLMEAQVVKGRLESEGIPALIRGEALATIYGLTAGNLAVAKVLVPAPLADKALALLFDEVEATELTEPSDPGNDVTS
jgi:hypothetical protein